jgi:hypothetical protein
MASVNSGGLTVPDDSDPVAQGAAAMRTMASKLGATASGSAGVTYPGGVPNAQSAVTFPAGRFTAAPNVVTAANHGTAGYVAAASAVTATGFTLSIRNLSGNPTAGTVVTAWWIATQA